MHAGSVLFTVYLFSGRVIMQASGELGVSWRKALRQVVIKLKTVFAASFQIVGLFSKIVAAQRGSRVQAACTLSIAWPGWFSICA
jgi:uncharacterized membrane protein